MLVHTLHACVIILAISSRRNQYLRGDIFFRLLANHVGWWQNNVGNPGFDISRNVLDLIYAQCLCW